ncbi:MAG: hypothetical protein AUK35_08925 [Zetaproteobacteria bacterium CG2_30_46_52]|nr:MAG: hypothetical protein AUK35_08925 [Zetaproteobacteria bacterium CG2_30_46_52]
MMNRLKVYVLFLLLAPSAVYAEEKVDCGDEYTSLSNEEVQRLPASEVGQVFLLKFPSVPNTVTLKESKRKSRIYGQVAEVFKGIAENKSALDDSAHLEECVMYEQGLKRATLEVTAETGKKKETYSLVVGPAEYLFLSADMPISNVKQLKYDAKTNTVIEKEKPALFYVSLNGKFGDIYTNYKAFDYRNLSMKLLFNASGQPSASIGIGLGYHFKYAEVFVARVTTANDESAYGSNVSRSLSNIWGVSFDIGKAASWLGGN